MTKDPFQSGFFAEVRHKMKARQAELDARTAIERANELLAAGDRKGALKAQREAERHIKKGRLR